MHCATAEVGPWPRVDFEGFVCMVQHDVFDAFRVFDGVFDNVFLLSWFVYGRTLLERYLKGLACYQFGGACDRPLKQ